MRNVENSGPLEQENERLRQENTRLRLALEDLQTKLSEPQEVIRAIQQGEIDAVVVHEQGEEQVYSLQRFDSLYRTVVEECFPYGVWLAKPSGRLLYVSPSFLKLLESDVEKLVEQGQFHFLPDETREAVEREWARCRETGQKLNVEYQVPLADGSEKTIWTQGLLAETPDGFSHWVGVNIDVTEREEVRAELDRQTEALRVSEAGFRLMADAMPQIVWVTRPDGYHEYFNRQWYDYIGCAPDEGLGEGWQNFLHPDDRERTVERWKTAVATGELYEIEYRFRGKDGQYRWFLGRALPARGESGRIVRWFGTCTDIEDMKRAGEALRESEARYRNTEERLMATLAASGTGTFRWEPETGIFLDFDENLKSLLGLPPDQLIQSTQDVIDSIHPDDRSTLEAALEACRQGVDFELEYRVILPNGNVRWLYDRAKMMRDSEGRPTYLLGACIDITERKETEEALKEADRRKDEFLAMLAHELRNPLAPIRSGLDILSMDGEDHQPIVKLMQKQVEHVVRLVDDLLDVSRIMRGRIELRRKPVQLSVLVNQSVAAVRSLIESQQQELVVSLPVEPIWLDVDPVRLVQVIENLLNNASKYTKSGGRIELSADRRGGQVEIRVRDTGIGIEPDLLPKVFELFTQSSRSLDRAQGGLGIGLTLVQRLVEMHDGEVSAYSQGVGHGSTFSVRLPATKAASRVEGEVEEPKIAQDRRILLVDDNAPAAAMLAKLLARLGNHSVETVHDGQTALSKVRRCRPDIILLDIGLPGMDGYQIGRAMREIPDLDDVLLVALTGYGQEEDRRKSKDAGFDEHLVKPPSIEQIRDILNHPKLTGSSPGSRSDGPPAG